jgi:cobalt-zinc-cadmium efflux system protein
MNIRSAFLHVLTDTFSSVAIIIGGIIIHYTGFTLLDSILSMLIAVLILIWAWRLIRESTDILLEAAPAKFKHDELRKAIIDKFPNVVNVHDLHCWVITSSMYTATLHIVVDDCSLSAATTTIHDISEMLKNEFNIIHVTIQIESVGSESSHECCF